MKFFTRITLLLICCLSVFSAKAVTSSFIADATSGCAPLVVHFTNTSTGATTYFWDLGNGTTSTLKDVSGTYLTPGTYIVKLVATGGGTSVTYTMTITVHPLPTVSFFADKTAVCPGSPVTFTSTSSGGVPGPMTYTWNFGDGFLGSGTPATHTYLTPGFYKVTLSVTNATGCSNVLSIPSFIQVYNKPLVNFAVSTSHFCSPPGAAVFTNLTTGKATLTYAWSFGDGGTSLVTNPSHTYAAVGTYAVKLVAKDGNGCMDSLNIPGFITVADLKASFTSVSSICEGSTVSFTNTTTAPYTTSNWDFGDGGTSTVTNPTHIYTTTSPTPYTVRLIVFDGYCYDTAYHTVKVNAGPAATMIQTPLQPCPPPVSIGLKSSLTGTTVNWIFGDGTTGTGSPVTHTFPHRGVDTIKMISIDPATGCRDTVIRIDTLYDMDLTIIDTPWGCKPLKVHFDVTALTHAPDTLAPAHPYPFPIVSYTWGFGDGSPVTTGPPPFTHTYTAVGVYKTWVTVTTSNGCTFTDTGEVRVGVPPTVSAVIFPKRVCFHHEINIPIKVLTGIADDYFWDFGPPTGMLEHKNDSLHMYFPIPGFFTCTVYASYNGCMSPPFVLTDTMIVDSPQAKIGIKYACKPRNVVNFTNNSLGADTYEWIFGDGTSTSTVMHPSHTYPTLGKYTVKLATYNKKSGCRDTATEEIDLTPPVIDYTADRTSVCRDEIIRITPFQVSGPPIRYFDWWLGGVHFTDTFHVKPITTIFIDTYFVTGRYSPMLVVLDNLGCLDTLIKKDYLTVAKPVAKFTVSPPSGCRSLLVTFKDVSTDVSGVALTNFNWTFGDGATASVSTPTTTHIYTANGSYSVDEIVTDAIGCKDTAHFTPIVVTRPVALFSVSNPAPCAYDSIYFVNSSIDMASAFWDFGDGTTSTAISTWHVYKTAGSFTVTLVVKDVNGCTDTLRKINYINISKPTASFHMSDSFSVCPPLTVVFYNTSGSGAISYSWSFGDGNTSAAIYPSDLYVKTGHYIVTLVATDGNGCVDTAHGAVDIFGYAGAFTYTPLKGCAPLSVHFKSNFTNVFSYIWDFADGITSAPSGVDNIDHVYTNPGAYVPKLILSDNTGCQNSSMGLDTIKVNAIYPGFTTDPSPACEKGVFYFKDTSHSYYAKVNSWFWTFNGSDTSSLMSPTNTYTLAGTYPATLIVTDDWGCSATVNSTVVVSPPPHIIASPDTVVCLGDGGTLTGYGGVSYTWEPASLVSCTNCNPTLGIPKVVTTFTVTGKDKNGCTNTDTVTLRLKYKTVSAAYGDTTVCYGVIVPLLDSGATKFTWLPEAGLSDPTIANPMASPDTTTNYMIIAQLGSCIPDTNFVKVTVYPVPLVDAGPDQTMVAGMSADIKASGSGIYSVSWGNDSTLSCNTCLTPKATPFVTTAYVITVTSEFGCPNSDTVAIHLYCDKSQIFVPNTFTPNGDGQNDVFYPRGRGISMVKSFRIYNRWGQLLFERSNIQLNDATNAWDGSFQGDLPRPDVYVYALEAVCDAGDEVNLKGDVTIIR